MSKFSRLVFSFIFLLAAAAWAAPVPETGQTKCYNNDKEIFCPSPGQPFYGQDANYTINPISYTKLDASGNALPDSAASWVMVKDNVTGLIWEMKANKDGVKKYEDPHDADNTYTWYDSNPATNGGYAGTPRDGTDTEDFIKALNDAKYGGYSDWRMPTIKELAYIFDYSIRYPGPTINAAYFPNTVASFYWSSSTYAYKTSRAWGVDFDYGNDDYIYYKSYTNYVRAVRGGQSVALGDSVTGLFDTLLSEEPDEMASTGGYTDNGDGTVTDVSTGLMWQKEASSETMGWEKSLAYCESLNTGGYTDWRLPTTKELRSLVDYTQYNPAINTTYFPNTDSSDYWSSTTYASLTYVARGVDFNFGDDFNSHKNYSYYVRAVRGGQSGALANLVVSPLSSNVPKDAGTTPFSVSNTGTGTMPWTAAITSGGDWLTITSGASGTNAGTITCAYTGNIATTSRTGTIRITADGATGSPKDVTVIQATGQVEGAVKFWGAWPDGVYVWNQSTRLFTKIAGTANAIQIAAGKIHGDAVDDLIGVWSSGLWVRYAVNGQWLKLNSSLPNWIAAGDMTKDGRDDVIGSWPNEPDGYLVYRDTANGQWYQIASPALELAVGDMDGDGQDDLAGVWGSGIWVRYSAKASWQKLDNSIPIWICTGDMNGDKRADIVTSYSSGTWYRDSASGSWNKLTTSAASKLTAGDINGDDRDDLIGVWSDGVWVRYGKTNQWQKISSSRPAWITTGITAAAAQSADGPTAQTKPETHIIDVSETAPGGKNGHIIVLDDADPDRME